MATRGVLPPNIRELQKYRVNRPNEPESIYQPYYDWLAYPAIGANLLTFFAVPVGGGASVMGVAGPKTIEDTNMLIAGSLPAPKRLLVTAISLCFLPGSPPSVTNAAGAAIAANQVNDQYAVMTRGALVFTVGSKVYHQNAPIAQFVPEWRMGGFSAAANTNATSQDNTAYSQWGGYRYEITPIELISTQNFSVSLVFSALVPTPSTVAARIGCQLHGFEYRLSQ